MGLASIVKKVPKAKDTSLKWLLHAHMTGYSPARSLKTMHASELTKADGVCPRYYALADVTHHQPKDEWLTTSMSMTYQLGREIQDMLVHKFADMGRAIGHWKCLGCMNTVQFTSRPDRCKECGAKHFRPIEVRFVSAKTGASCGIDMLVRLDGEPKLIAVEIKTINQDDFKQLVAPMAEHRLRTNFYCRIIAESGTSFSKLVNTSKAWVLYVSKGGYGCADSSLAEWGSSDRFSPIKEFAVVRKDSDTESMATVARIVRDFRDEKIPMPTGLCATALSPRAKKCELRAQCFSGDYPPEHDWSEET